MQIHHFIELQYNQDFEQFQSSLKQSDSDPVGILDEYFTFLAKRDKPLANNTIRFYRAKTYLDVEHALTIAETEKIDQNYSDMQRDNSELRGIVDNLSRQLQSLERRIGV